MLCCWKERQLEAFLMETNKLTYCCQRIKESIMGSTQGGLKISVYGDVRTIFLGLKSSF